MNPLDLLFGQIQKTINNHSSADTPGPSYDANPLLGTLAGLFGQHASGNNESFGVDSSQFGNVQDASQDPYGDPADQQQPTNVRDASEDPYGDPADGR